jgi:cbb3-type cytochrome oxidase subunit 3
MATWLDFTSPTNVEIWTGVLVRAVLALITGSAVAWVYRATRRGPYDASSSFPATLVLLCVLIGIATQVIGDNIARAFGLAGALSVVRFRTVVRDTMDTAFVIFAVVEGMAIGAGQPVVAVIGLVVSAVTAFVFRDQSRSATMTGPRATLQVKFVWSEQLDTALRGVLSEFAEDIQVHGAASVRQGTGMELTYDLILRPDRSMSTLLFSLSRLEGVISSEIARNSSES